MGEFPLPEVKSYLALLVTLRLRVVICGIVVYNSFCLQRLKEEEYRSRPFSPIGASRHNPERIVNRNSTPQPGEFQPKCVVADVRIVIAKADHLGEIGTGLIELSRLERDTSASASSWGCFGSS